MLPLSNATLSDLKDVAVPSYDRSRLTAGIVHFGVGGFHRAHEAMYLDRLMTEGKAHDWTSCGRRTGSTRWSSRRRTAGSTRG